MAYRRWPRTVALLTAFTVGVVVSGCASSGASVDRERTYDLAMAMAQDSDLVAVGAVTGSTEVADIEGSSTVVTVSDVAITEVVRAAEGDAWVPGDTVRVRQLGPDSAPPPVELVRTGRTYLLFLTLSGPDGEIADQFYVTGSSAGLYEPAPGGLPPGTFRQLGPSELKPALVEVTLADLG